MDNSKLTICKRCIDNLRNEPSETYLDYKGFYTVFKVPEDKVCPICKDKLSTVNISQDDAIILTEINNDSNFLGKMIKLHEENITEYESKMALFRNQIEQRDRQKVDSKNIPKCPTCGSTNIQKISIVERSTSVLMLGLFSKKINKSYKCKSCGYTW